MLSQILLSLTQRNLPVIAVTLVYDSRICPVLFNMTHIFGILLTEISLTTLMPNILRLK